MEIERTAMSSPAPVRRWRGLMAVLSTAGLVAVGVFLAAPAHATTCTGTTQEGITFSGTSGDDNIVCETVDAGHYVNGGSGNDTITVNGTVSGQVSGDSGDDKIIVNGTVAGTVSGGGDKDTISISAGPRPVMAFIARGVRSLNGQAGDDTIEVTGNNAGTVDGGDDRDDRTVGSGNLPVNCEQP